MAEAPDAVKGTETSTNKKKAAHSINMFTGRPRRKFVMAKVA